MKVLPKKMWPALLWPRLSRLFVFSVSPEIYFHPLDMSLGHFPSFIFITSPRIITLPFAISVHLLFKILRKIKMPGVLKSDKIHVSL